MKNSGGWSYGPSPPTHPGIYARGFNYRYASGGQNQNQRVTYLYSIYVYLVNKDKLVVFCDSASDSDYTFLFHIEKKMLIIENVKKFLFRKFFFAISDV